MRKNLSSTVMLIGSVMIIAIVFGLMTHHEVRLRRDENRARGVALASALSRIPLDRLATTGSRLGPLPLIQASLGQSDFAYAAVADADGGTLDAVSQVGTLPPFGSRSDDPASWSDQWVVEPVAGLGPIREFTAPVIDGGELVARVRIAFLEPTHLGVALGSSLYAGIALLIFLAFPLSYAWLWREIRPLSDVARALPSGNDDFESRVASNAPPTQTIESIALRFRTFCEEMEDRAEGVAREKMGMLAAAKVASHERNRILQVLEAMPDVVLALSAEGKITIANARANSMFKRTRDDLSGLTPREWCSSDELIRLIGRNSGSNSPLLRAESMDVTFAELGDRYFHAVLRPLPDSDGMVLVIRDVTAEQAARETQAEFLGHMAHELKAPLNVISMYSESLSGPDGAAETARVDACNVINDEVDRLSGLINNIFSIGRIESGIVSIDRQRVRTKEFLTDIFESTSRVANELDLEFSLKLSEPLQAIHVDKQLMSVAVKNLLTNATKYNREGGHVELIAAEDENGLLITVRDSGVGIRDEDLDQVFEKFYRSEDDSVRKIAGHGLGLALVKEIVVLHGGEIRAQSVLGEGSEFSLFFGKNAAIFQEAR